MILDSRGNFFTENAINGVKKTINLYLFEEGQFDIDITFVFHPS